MLNSGKKFPALRDKKINILTLVLSETKFLNETKNHKPPPLKVGPLDVYVEYWTDVNQTKNMYEVLLGCNKSLI